MGLKYSEFEVLREVASCRDSGILLPEIEGILEATKSRVNNTLKELINKHLIVKTVDQKIIITPKGLEKLEPYRVKRAIIIAAGKGQRMLPETLLTPKPLVKITNKSIIETQLDALMNAGITDITIVRGYLGHMFDDLLDKYPGLKFIENSSWQTEGAIISASLAIDLLEGAYLIEGDVYIRNPNIISPYQYKTTYCGISGDVKGDWYFRVDGKNSRIIEHGKGDKQNKNEDVFKFVGIMHWTKDDAIKIKKDLEGLLRVPKNRQEFIESIPFFKESADYNIYTMPVAFGDVVEVDTYWELKNLRSVESSLKISSNNEAHDWKPAIGRFILSAMKVEHPELLKNLATLEGTAF